MSDLTDARLDEIEAILGDIDDLVAEVRRLRAAIAEADRLHPYELDPDPEIEEGVVHWCDTCDTPAPCDTRRALHPEEADHAE